MSGEFYKNLTDVVGTGIKEITGYVTSPFDADLSFKLCKIIFEDGRELHVEGEHDFPYIAAYGHNFPELDPDNLKQYVDEG